MASITSLTSSSSGYSSIYGAQSANMVTGLMSGLDTESMIEGLVESYQLKISGYQQDRTVLQWQQDSLRGVIDDLAVFSEKYTSFTSDTNISSNSFFTNAINIETMGEFSSAISASGQTNSDIIINSVSQLATASQYRVSASDLTAATGASEDGSSLLLTGDSVDLSSNIDISTLEGSLTLQYGTSSVTIDFGELETLEPDSSGNISAQSLKTAIEEKLAEESISISGNTYTADERINVEVDSAGVITFSDKSSAGNSVVIKSATGELEKTLGLENIEDDVSTINTAGVEFTKSESRIEFLKGSTITFELNGLSKNITVGDDWTAENFNEKMQAELDRNFGENKITYTQNASGEVEIRTAKGSTLSVSAEKGEAMGLGEGGNLSTTLDVQNTTLGDLGITNYDLTINGVSVGDFNEDTALESVLYAINSNADAGVEVSYSELTNEFVFSARQTGEGGKIELGGLGTELFGDATAGEGVFTEGKDSVFNVTVNGTNMTLTRSSNDVDLDGMTVIFKDTFNEGTFTDTIKSADVAAGVYTEEQLRDVTGEAIEFRETTDTDKVYDAIKEMVDDYNEMVKTVKDLYTTMPLENSSGDRYEPLTDADRADLSDTQIEEFEKSAKTGILFMDNDLDSLSSKLSSAITSLTSSNKALADMGITTAYDSGLTTIKLDEQKMRTAIETDIDSVQQVFTSSKEDGASYDGIMTSLKEVTDMYAATTGAQKGILVERAGSQLAPTSILDNTLLSEMNDIDDYIETWQDKLSNQIDYYTSQFTQLEVLINEMNSQSSALAGLTTGA